MNNISQFVCGVLLLLLGSCNNLPSDIEEIDRLPSMFPDYSGVTIPINIAPLNFSLETEGVCKVLFSGVNYQFIVSGTDYIDIPLKKWKQLLGRTKDNQVAVTVYQKEEEKWIKYQSFYYFVSSDSIDNYLTYRLIEPTYANWNEMGIYQRNLSSFSEKEIVANDKTGHNCMNCHAFNQRNPQEMVMHMRKTNSGTILIREGQAVKLDTKTDYTISNFVYPYWHPAGNNIAFSTNNTQMSFYEANDEIIEVYDLHSDIVMYDIMKNEAYTSPLLSSPEQLENFPVFSADGKILYFCTSPEVDSLPQNNDQVKYKLCSIGFDVTKQQFATEVDTLIDLSVQGKGVSLPSISPDGHYIICSVASNGCFHSWDKDSDLYLYDTAAKILKPLDTLNTNDSESYTSWSTNSRWIVFSSRRLDGVYNRPFFVHVDKEGKVGKPFILPQKVPAYYQSLFKAYNLPQFITGEVTMSPHEIAETTTASISTLVKFRKEAHTQKVATEAENKGEVN